jgi:hypothetical protein
MTVPNPSAAPGAPADGGTGGQAPTGTQPPAAQPAPTGQQPGPGAQPQPTDLSTLPADVRKLIEDTRAEAAKHRTEKATATTEAQAAKAQRDAVLKAMGLNADGTDAPPTTDALTAQVEQQQAVAWTAAVELNVFRTAQAAGANGEALLDSRAFIDSLDPFTDDDPASPEFRTKLAEHVKKYVEQHPTFKAGPPAATRSGGDHPGGSGNGGPGSQRSSSLGAAVKAHYNRT